MSAAPQCWPVQPGRLGSEDRLASAIEAANLNCGIAEMNNADGGRVDSEAEEKIKGRAAEICKGRPDYVGMCHDDEITFVRGGMQFQ